MVITMREEEKQKRSPAVDPSQTVLLVGDFSGVFSYRMMMVRRRQGGS